jgi:hypothetical protein
VTVLLMVAALVRSREPALRPTMPERAAEVHAYLANELATE